MRGKSGWVLLLGLVLLAVTLLLVQAGNSADSPSHSSNSDGRNGTSALRQFSSALGGHLTSQLDASFTLPTPPATLFVFDPTYAFTAGETTTLVDWVKSGGTLVYGADELDVRLALAFDIHLGQTPVPATGRPVIPAFQGVRTVTDESYARAINPTPAQATLFAFRPGQALVIEQAVGQGRLLAISAPEILCNGWLEKADNGRFAADLIGMTPGPVVFDEFHHGENPPGAGSAGGPLGRNPRAAGDITRQPLGIAMIWAALAIFAGLLLRGRAFGPRIAVGSGRGRSAAEYVAAVGNLLHRSGGRALALQVLADATQRALAARLGFGGSTSAGRLDEMLERREPELAARYAEAIAVAGRATASEAALLDAARRLHDLAYPMASTQPVPKEKH